MNICLASILKQKNMSRYELARKIDVTYPTITAICNGTTGSIKFDILEKICQTLECTPDDLLGYNKKYLSSNGEGMEVSDNFMNPPDKTI